MFNDLLCQIKQLVSNNILYIHQILKFDSFLEAL